MFTAALGNCLERRPVGFGIMDLLIPIARPCLPYPRDSTSPSCVPGSVQEGSIRFIVASH